MSTPLKTWLSNASAGDTFNTIVTFHNRDGMSTLDGLGVANTDLQQLPMSFAKLTPTQIRELASSSNVRSLWHDHRMELYLDKSVKLTKADQVWTGTGLRRGYTGAGVGVAVIDTGTDGLHPDLLGKVKGFTATGNPDYFEEGERGLLVPTVAGEQVDTYGHGTHVSSTIAGTGAASGGKYKGMAPDSTIYSFKTDAGPYLWGGYILASFDWIAANDDALNIRVSSNSWGSGNGNDYNPDDPINVATKALYDDGVSVVFAASNDGMPNTLNQYATSPWVISVAAGTKDNPATTDKNEDRQLASFSSRGRFDDENGTVDINWDRRKAQRNDTGVYRPTITAPGASINAAKSASAVVMATGTDPNNPFYTFASGTSMATPHVAGAIALMVEARPALQPQHVIDIIEGTADNMPSYEIFEVGMGHLDALEAVQAAEKGKVKFPPPINGATPEFTRISASDIRGQALTNTWALVKQRECRDDEAHNPDGVFSRHEFTVTEGTDAVYAEIQWNQEDVYDITGPKDLIYLRLYAPDCSVAAESAALLDFNDVNHRAVLVSNPGPGTWTVGVYGRINSPTPGIDPDTGLPYVGTAYTGLIGTYDKN